jgi:hypothetical protein
MAGSSPLDSSGAILSGLAKRLGLEPRLLELRLQREWRDLVGEPIASHTWPAQVRFKQLYLTVQNSVWLQQLTFLKPTLLSKLNADTRTECLSGIVLRVGQIPPRTTGTAADSPDATPVTAGITRAEAARHAAAIQDPELRERFTEVISKYPSPTPRPAAGGPSRVP